MSAVELARGPTNVTPMVSQQLDGSVTPLVIVGVGEVRFAHSTTNARAIAAALTDAADAADAAALSLQADPERAALAFEPVAGAA